jgi:hypothetical protein
MLKELLSVMPRWVVALWAVWLGFFVFCLGLGVCLVVALIRFLEKGGG